MLTVASYFQHLAPESFGYTIDKLAGFIKKTNPFAKANLLFGRGVSGALILPALAAKLQVGWAITRKEHDNTHSQNKVEVCFPSDERFIMHLNERGIYALFVDDLVFTGTTRNQCKEALKAEVERHNNERADYPYLRHYSLTFVGTVTYDRSEHKAEEEQLIS